MQIVGGFAILLLGVSISACRSTSTNPASTSTGGSAGATGGSSGAGAAGGASGAGGLVIDGGAGIGGMIYSNCAAVAPLCGPEKNDDCCDRSQVSSEPFPMGRSDNGTDAFATGNVDEQPEHTATPSTIELDVYEVTLARFKGFMDALPDSLPKPGDGEHPGIPNSGWDAAWDPEVSYLDPIVQCGNRSVWTFPPQEENYAKPINCLSWHIAFAFCAWDKGFLPTEAEWELAAAGGAENRLYPWGPNDPDMLHANYGCKASGTASECAFEDILNAGSIAGGKGKWGHYDLGGSMAEWTLDAYAPDWYATGGASCTNCANLGGNDRVLRGGDWMSVADDLRAAKRIVLPATDYGENTGVRCARTPVPFE